MEKWMGFGGGRDVNEWLGTVSSSGFQLHAKINVYVVWLASGGARVLLESAVQDCARVPLFVLPHHQLSHFAPFLLSL